MSKASGGSQRRKLTASRKRSGQRGTSQYQAKQTMPYSQTMAGPKQRIRRIFDGFRVVNQYAETAPEQQAPISKGMRRGVHL